MTPVPRPDIIPVAEDAVLLVFADVIDPALTPVIIAWREAILQRLGPLLTDVVPSYSSITLYYDPCNSDFRHIINELKAISGSHADVAGSLEGRRIELPVWYDPSVGPDLKPLAQACSLTPAQVAERHTAVSYQVYALGFSPGFAFMGQVDTAIAQPRLRRPRQAVPAGSVGIANRQTAVYPSVSPGGWQLIGRCPTELFNEQELALLAVGDQVRFRAVDHATFLELGGDDTPFTDREGGG